MGDGHEDDWTQVSIYQASITCLESFKAVNITYNFFNLSILLFQIIIFWTNHIDLSSLKYNTQSLPEIETYPDTFNYKNIQ